MIYFTAVNDIGIDSKYTLSLAHPKEGNSLKCWGITELSTTTFKKIEKGDFVLFYHNFRIVGIGKVDKTKVDKTLSKKLWGSYIHKIQGELFWSNIIEFSEFNSVSLPFEQIIELGNYSKKYSIRRIIALNDVGMQRINSKYGNPNKFVESILNLNKLTVK